MKVDIEHRGFGYKGSPVLRDIDISLDGPGLYCIIGPNGVGKSTLVKCMMKILSPTSGRILVNGRDIEDISLKEYSRMATFVPSGTPDVFSLTVMDTVLTGLSGINRGYRRIEKAYAAMSLLGIEDLAMRDAGSLSAGQRQKVAIARGLIRDTELLILDEPTSNLDIRHQVYVTEMLEALARRTSKMIVMISHDINIASKYADQMIVLEEPGVVFGIGAPEDIVDDGMLDRVYGIGGEIVEHAGRPHVMIDHAISGRDGRI